MDIRVYKDIEELSKEAARLFEYLSKERDGGRNGGCRRPFTVALSGGSTPKVLYSMLASAPYREDIAWKDTVIFFGDERLVARDSGESNYRMVSENLLMNIDIPAENIHAIEEELPPKESAELYEKKIKGVFKSLGDESPVLDLVLLGLGTDGHTLSIFPGSPALHERDKLVVGVDDGPKDTNKRVSMTLPLINNAKNIVVLVSGESKAEALRDVLKGRDERLPASLIEPKGHLIYLIDEAAASLL